MANTSMWIKALKTIPRISPEEWKALDVVSRWLIATRSAVFIMTALSAGIGGLLAWRYGAFHLPYFLASMVGLIFAHASNNLINDYVDHRKGIDKDNYYRSQYGPQPLEHGLMTRKELFGYIAFSLIIAMLAGIYLVYSTGWITLGLLLTGLFFLVFYTWPLKYVGLGEPTVLLVWGPLMIGGTFYVSSGGIWDWTGVLIGLVYAIGPTTVLFGKHTDKLNEDRGKKVYTLPVILGEKLARYSTIGLWIAQFVILGVLVLAGMVGPLILLALLAFPKFIWASRIFSKPRPTEAPADLPPNTWPLYLSAHAFVYNRRFGMLFLLGLIAEVIWVKAGIQLF